MEQLLKPIKLTDCSNKNKSTKTLEGEATSTRGSGKSPVNQADPARQVIVAPLATSPVASHNV